MTKIKRLFVCLLIVLSAVPSWAGLYMVQQSTTAYPLVFFMADSSDHVSAKTGLTCTVTLSKAGGSFASPAGSVTEIANGWYKVAGNATDTATLGPLILHASGTGADPTDATYEVVAVDPQTTAFGALKPATAGRTLVVDASGLADANTVKIGPTGSGTAQTARDIGTSVLLSSGTGTGQLDFTSGVVKSNVTQSNGTTNAGAAGYFALDFAQAVPSAPTANTVGEVMLLNDIARGRFNTAQAGSSTTITLDSGASSVDNTYVGDCIYLPSGTGGGLPGSGQRRTVVSYVGSTKVATVDRAWTTTPDNTTKFITLPEPLANVGLVAGTTAQATAGYLKTIPATRRTIYVASTGSDSNSGLLFGSPLLTVTAAASAVQRGDAIYIEDTITNATSTPDALPDGVDIIGAGTTLSQLLYTDANGGIIFGNCNRLVGVRFRNSSTSTGAAAVAGVGNSLVAERCIFDGTHHGFAADSKTGLRFYDCTFLSRNDCAVFTTCNAVLVDGGRVGMTTAVSSADGSASLTGITMQDSSGTIRNIPVSVSLSHATTHLIGVEIDDSAANQTVELDNVNIYVAQTNGSATGTVQGVGNYSGGYAVRCRIKGGSIVTSGGTSTLDINANFTSSDVTADGTLYSASKLGGSTAIHSPLTTVTPRRALVVDAAGLADATAVKYGPSGSAVATATDDIALLSQLSNANFNSDVRIGLDWSRVSNPTTSLVLSGTTIGLATDITTKTGFRLSSTGVDDIWDEALAGHTTGGTSGKGVADASSAGNPWSALTASNNDSNTFGHLVQLNLDAKVSEAGGSSGTVSPFILNDDHTWSFDSRDQITSPDILTESVGEATIFKAVDFDVPLTENGSIFSVGSVTVANVADATEPTITSAVYNANKRKVHLTINASVATAATYTISVPITTTDGRTFTRKVKLNLQ